MSSFLIRVATSKIYIDELCWVDNISPVPIEQNILVLGVPTKVVRML